MEIKNVSMGSKTLPSPIKSSATIVPRAVKSEFIQKFPVKANLENYAHTYDTFNYSHIQEEITFYGDGTINAAFNAVDRHLFNGRTNKVALYLIDKNLVINKLTYQDLHYKSNKIANALHKLSVKKGDRVFIFLPRIEEVYTATLAIARLGAIAGPLFSAFGPDALLDRLLNSSAKVVITDMDLKDRIDSIKDKLPNLETVLVIGGKSSKLKKHELCFEDLVDCESEVFHNAHMSMQDPLYMLYTSGTSGKPKGVVHAHSDLLGHHMTSKWVLDLRDDDVYWCTADPGWVTGTVYGIYGPLSNGASVVCLEAGFNPDTWYSIIDQLKVTVWYTSPTALRMLMKEGSNLAFKFNLSSLRHILSVGEPLNPEVIKWGMETFGLPIHDTWWQTETGMQMICNLPCLPIKPGSMGKPLPGIYAAIVDDYGYELGSGVLGKLCIKPNWPAMLTAVWNDKDRYDEYFKIPNWYFTGDNAWRDEDNYFWFVGRADDVINTAGHRVGPFEVESALLEHKYIVEAGVIGKPDDERGEIIKAFIVLADDVIESEQVLADIKAFIRNQLAAHAYPREIEVRKNLPKTRSGKIMRRVLKATELGLPLGDLSGLDD